MNWQLLDSVSHQCQGHKEIQLSVMMTKIPFTYYIDSYMLLKYYINQ